MMHEYIGKVVSISLMMFSLSVFGGELKLERYAGIEYQFAFPSSITFNVSSSFPSVPALVTFAPGYQSNYYETIFTRCSGTATVNGKKGKKIYNIICTPNNGIASQSYWGVGTGSHEVFEPGDNVVWNIDVAGIMRAPATSIFGVTIVNSGLNLVNGTFIGDPSMILTSGSRVIKIPLKYGSPDVTLPPNKGTAVVVLNYPSSITSDADKDGGYRTNLLKLTGGAGGKVSLTTTISPLSGAKVIKNGGGDCSQMTVNDSCDIIFPAGTVPPGQSLKGSINITATMM